MRPWTFLLIGILVLSTLGMPAAAEECPDTGCPEGDAGAAQNEDPDQGDTAPGEGADDRRAARERAIEERRTEGKQAWREIQAERGQSDAAHGRSYADLPAELRGRLGHLSVSDGALRGTFVTFAADEQLGVLQDVARGPMPLFQTIYLPVDADETATVGTTEKMFRASGHDWSFILVDHENGFMRFDASPEAPFLLTLPAGAQLEPIANGFQIAYAAPDGSSATARLRGTVTVDPADPHTLLVTDATFLMDADRLIMPQVTNKARPHIDTALAAGNLGAEATLLRLEDEDVYADSTIYGDLEMRIDRIDGVIGSEDLEGYALTVDSPTHTGKTIAVAFEAGLLDAETLRFRYYNLEGDSQHDAPIVRASSLADVLDPLDDGTVAEYWLVEDADGLQVLVSVPHFSVHQIQMLGAIDVVLERPSLLLGTIGAALLVGMATMGLFRRPQDEA